MNYVLTFQTIQPSNNKNTMGRNLRRRQCGLIVIVKE